MNPKYRRLWTPPPDEPIYEWARRSIILTPRQPTSFTGPYNAERTPYVKGVFDALRDIEVSRVTVCKGAQTGLTLAMHVALAYYVCNEPGPILLVMPSENNAQSASETRLLPLFQDSPACRQEFTGNVDDLKKLQYTFKRCVVNLVGSNSPANLASRPIKYLFLDEVDKFPTQTKTEAKAVNLAMERTKTFWDRKIIECSTPTTDATGHIGQAYELGDRRYYYIPCPHCEAMQYLKFPQIRFDETLEIPESAKGAWYECEECGRAITDIDKQAGLHKGEWRATAKPTNAGHVSFHLPALYAPWVTWADVVNEFRNTKDRPAEFQNFVNSWLAETWKEQPKENVSIGRVFDVRDELVYDRGVVPTADPVMMFATIDTQKRYFPYAVWAATLESLYLVDHGLYVEFKDVFDKTAQPFHNLAGAPCFVSLRVIDTGFGERTTETYEYCAKYPNTIPLKGDTGTITTQTQPFKVSPIYPKGMKQMSLIRTHPAFYKHRLLDSLARTTHPFIYLHSGVDMDFAEQLTGEVLMEEMNAKTGVPRQYFKVVRRPQDMFDLAQYALAVWHIGQADLEKLAREAPAVAVEEGTDGVFRPPPVDAPPPAPRRRVVRYGPG